MSKFADHKIFMSSTNLGLPCQCSWNLASMFLEHCFEKMETKEGRSGFQVVSQIFLCQEDHCWSSFLLTCLADIQPFLKMQALKKISGNASHFIFTF